MKLRIYNTDNVMSGTYFDADVYDAKVTRVLNARDEITFKCIAPEAIDWKIGSTLAVHIGKNLRYTMHELPSYEKKSSGEHIYQALFKAPVFDLETVAFLNTTDDGEFFFNGKAADFLDLIMYNLNRPNIDLPGNWQAGSCDNTEYLNLQFNNQNCWQALNLICTEFDLEFEKGLSGQTNTISLKDKVGTVKAVNLEYGKGSGLYNIKRTNVDVDKLVTRLYYRGSDRNLPPAYAHERLRGSSDYIESNVGLFGLREGFHTFDEIRPSFRGTVSGFAIVKPPRRTDYVLSIPDFPFDLNEKDEEENTKWLIPGTTAKINFLTGDCAGYTFDIEAYDHDTSELKIIPHQHASDYLVPNTTVQPASGDLYTIIDIIMPEVYVDNAVTSLDYEAVEYLSMYNTPRVSYTLQSDKKYFSANNINLDLGDQISVTDTDLSIAESCRVIEQSYPLWDWAEQVLKLSDVRFAIPSRNIQTFLKGVEIAIKTSKAKAPEVIQRSTRTTSELKNKVFSHNDEHFIPENNRPESLDPYMLALDAGEIQFSLKSTKIEANAYGFPSKVKVSAGELIHHSFAAKNRPTIEKKLDKDEEYNPARTWQIVDSEIEVETQNSHFIYLKVPLSESENEAEVVLDEEHIWAKSLVENDSETGKLSGYIMYKIGYLSEESGGKRSASYLWSESGDDKSHAHEQPTPLKEWLVEHKLNKHPAVSVVDSAGSVVEGVVEYIDLNNVRLKFNSAFSGTAYFN